MAMFNIKTLLSTFDKKGTLMKWLKELTEMLQKSALTGVSVEQTSQTKAVLKFNFETNKWEFIGVDNVELLTDVIMDQDDPEGYYMVSDLNDNPLELVDDSIDSEPDGLYYVTKDPETADDEDPDYLIKSLSEITSIMGIIKPFMEGYKKMVKSIEEKCNEAAGECECGHDHCHCHHGHSGWCFSAILSDLCSEITSFK